MSSQAPLNEEEVARYTQESVLYFLSQHAQNSTIKRSDFVKTVLADTSRRLQNEVIKQTRDNLKRVYGLGLREIDEGGKHYLLVNEVEYNPEVPLYWPEPLKNEQTLLLPILAVIFMNGGSMPETDLWTFLRDLKVVTASSKIHEKFGDVDHLVKKVFVNQRYLIYEAIRQGVEDDQEKIFQFRWGIRAQFEVSEEKILQHVCQILGREMTDFAEQYSQVTHRRS